MEFILLAFVLAWLTKDDEKAEQRKKIAKEHKARIAREKAKKKRRQALARKRWLKRRMKKLERDIRKRTTGYATPKHKREANRLHREFLKRQREYNGIEGDE